MGPGSPAPRICLPLKFIVLFHNVFSNDITLHRVIQKNFRVFRFVAQSFRRWVVSDIQSFDESMFSLSALSRILRCFVFEIYSFAAQLFDVGSFEVQSLDV